MAALKKAATKKVAKKAVGAPRGRAAQAMEFTQSLVLNQWLFGLFGLDSTDGYYTLDGGRRVPLLEAFKQRFQLNEHSEEGLDENNVHRFHHALINQITGELPGVSKDELLAREHAGPDEDRPERGRADHPAVRPRRAPEGAWLEPEAQQGAAPARRHG